MSLQFKLDWKMFQSEQKVKKWKQWMQIYFQTFLVTVVLKRTVIAGGGYMPRNVCLKIGDSTALWWRQWLESREIDNTGEKEKIIEGAKSWENERLYKSLGWKEKETFIDCIVGRCSSCLKAIFWNKHGVCLHPESGVIIKECRLSEKKVKYTIAVSGVRKQTY